MAATTRDGRAWDQAFLLAIDHDTCIGCGRCFKVCGRQVMTLMGRGEDGLLVVLDSNGDDDEIERKVMALVDAGACVGCGACARVCPTGSQTHGASGAEDRA